MGLGCGGPRPWESVGPGRWSPPAPPWPSSAGASAVPVSVQGGQSPRRSVPTPSVEVSRSPAPLALPWWKWALCAQGLCPHRPPGPDRPPTGRGWPPSCSSSCARRKTTFPEWPAAPIVQSSGISTVTPHSWVPSPPPTPHPGAYTRGTYRQYLQEKHPFMPGGSLHKPLGPQGQSWGSVTGPHAPEGPFIRGGDRPEKRTWGHTRARGWAPGGPGSSLPLRWDGNRPLQPQLRQDRSLQPGAWGGAARGGSREQQTCGISEVLPETLPAPSGTHRSRTR